MAALNRVVYAAIVGNRPLGSSKILRSKLYNLPLWLLLEAKCAKISIMSMRRNRYGRWVAIFSLAVTLCFAFTSPTYAVCATNPDLQACSTGQYGVGEVFFGSGGELQACSTGQYCAKQSAGELTVGNTKGGQYQAQAGFNTDRTPWIEVVVEDTAVDVGVLSTSHPNVGTARFYVKSYLSSGYVVQTWGGPPKNGSRLFATPSTPAASTPGTEQFGINLAANTGVTGAVNGSGTATPNFGAVPTQDPDSTFSFGKANDGTVGGAGQVYNTANSFKYTNGDIIAYSTSSSGYTHYTVSYLFNVSPVTPGGTYTMNHVLVATATF